jgi:stage IV sporulation protein FB
MSHGLSERPDSDRPGFLIVLAVLCLMDMGGLLPAAVVAVAVHELGHVLALKLSGGQIASIRLEWAGLSLVYSGRLSYGEEIASAALGPCASFLLALVASCAGRITGWDWAYLLAGVSFVFGAFNLLPALPLDGGRLLLLAVSMKAGPFLGERVTCIVSCIVIFLLLVAGTALLIWTRSNPTLLIAAFWMLLSFCGEAEYNSGADVQTSALFFGYFSPDSGRRPEPIDGLLEYFIVMVVKIG